MLRNTVVFPNSTIYPALLAVAGAFATPTAMAQNVLFETCLEANGPPDALRFACSRALSLPEVSAATRATLLVRRAQLHASARRSSDALSDIAAALNANPYSASAYRLRGLLRHHDGDTNGALADFAKAIALNPHDARPHSHKAAVLLQLNRRTQATAAALQALSIEPGNPLAHLILGAGAFAARDFATAAEHFRTVLDGPRLNYPLAAFWYAAAVARNGGDGKAAFAPYSWWWNVGGWPEALADVFDGSGNIENVRKTISKQDHAGRAQALFFLAQWQFANKTRMIALNTLAEAAHGAPHLLEVIVAKFLLKNLSN